LGERDGWSPPGRKGSGHWGR